MTEIPYAIPTPSGNAKISYTDVLSKELKVMDATAIAICRENRLPVVVFNLLTPGTIQQVITGKTVGTIVED
jgi:uridylate kinase